MNTRFLLGLIGCGLWMSGCGQSLPDHNLVIGENEREADTATPIEAARHAYSRPLPPIPEVEVDLPPLLPFNQGAGVLNRHFAEYTDDIPTYWYTRGPSRVRRGGPDRGLSVWLLNGSIAQDLEFDESPAGTTIIFTAGAKCDGPDQAWLSIETPDRVVIKRGEAHPGDARWQKISVTAQIPEDYQGNTVTIAMVYRNPNENNWAFFDEPDVYVE